MAGKTDRTGVQYAFKKLSGRANTSNIKSDAQEVIGSNIQVGSQTIFGQDIPNSGSRIDFNIYSNTAEYVVFTVSVITGTTYDADSATGGGGDGSQSAGPHGYKLFLTGNYESLSSNPRKGSSPFTNGSLVHESLGGLQLIPPNFSQEAPNPFIVKIYEADGSDANVIGDEIPLLDEVDWTFDYYNGILFLQDYDSGKIPAFAKGFLYVGSYLSASLGGGSGDSAASYVVMSATGSLSSERVLTSGTGINVTDAGAGSTVTLGVDNSIVATISGSAFTGGVKISDNIRVTGTGSFDTGISGSLTRLTDGTSYLAAGSNVTITSASNGQIVIASTATGAGGGSGVGWTSPTAGKITSTGSIAAAGGQLGTSYVATNIGTDVFFFVSGTIDSKDTSNTGSAVFGGDVVVSGALNAPFGLSGSLTRLTDGSSYLIAGSNVTITSASNGAVTIASSGGGGSSDGTNFFTSPAAGKINTTGSAVFAGGELGSSYVATTIGTDVFFFVSGTIGSKDTAATGSAVFGGDLLVSGTVNAPRGLSGSLTRLTDGSSYLAAGSNVTILSSSNGQITISSAEGGTTVVAGLLIREIADREVNGSISKFYITGSPNPNSTVGVYINGLLMMSGAQSDYTYAASDTSVTFTFIPPSGSSVQFEYSSGSDRTTNAIASGLATATTTVEIGDSAAPASGSILVARSSTEAIWQPAMVFGEAPSGTKNGVNVTFALARAPINGTDLMLFVNGLLQASGTAQDYELTASTINFKIAPYSEDSLNAIYRPSY